MDFNGLVVLQKVTTSIPKRGLEKGIFRGENRKKKKKRTCCFPKVVGRGMRFLFLISDDVIGNEEAHVLCIPDDRLFHCDVEFFNFAIE
jgi:hypothetical protein